MNQEENLRKDISQFIISFILFLIAIILSYILPIEKEICSFLIFVISYLIVGREVVMNAIKNVFHGEVFDENFLMSIATIGAFLIKEYPDAVAVMLFYQLGEIFQSYAVNHSRKSIASLMNLKPEYANVEKNVTIEKKLPEQVKIGDIIVIKPGEKVPLDGTVIKGNSFLDMSALTGESVPKRVSINDSVLSGCINQDSLLKVKVTCEYQYSTVSKILDLVEHTSSRKANAENFITKFARYYTPIVVILALLFMLIPPFLTKTSFSVWFYRSLSFLVVSCPCALVISIPLGFFSGIGLASKHGILVKGSNYLEALSKVDTVVFDKTGTLTEGVFEVQEIKPVDITKDKLLEMVALAEIYSNHPIATSVKKVYHKTLKKERVEEVKELSGLGIYAFVDQKEVLVGNEKLMKKYQITIEKCNKVGTILYVAIDKKHVGYLVISDKIKTTTPKAIQALKDASIHRLIMLTGDKLEIGQKIAKELNIDSVYAELLPNEKVEKLQQIIHNNPDRKIAYVGDGINDAPVLAMADIGIAMGGVGSDAAIETSDIVIMTDDLVKLADAISLSKQTLKIVKQNISFSISIKILILILIALGISTMWMAVFADVGVSFLAILNSLRLLKTK